MKTPDPLTARALSRCAAAVLLAIAPLAVRAADNDAEPRAIEPHARIYPEWKWQDFGQPSRAGDEAGTLGTLRNDTTRLVKNAAAKDSVSEHAWSSSFAGIRGAWALRDWRVGYDLQVTVDLQGNSSLDRNFDDNLETRDAYVYVARPDIGSIAVGKMDSVYKDWVDKGTMLGLTQGNFVSYAQINARAGWKGKGSSSFFVRRSHAITWSSPEDREISGAIMHSWDEGPTGPGGHGTQLTAAALRWTRGPWSTTLATEHHRDWLPMSQGATTSATSIYNDPSRARSSDQAWRLGVAWREGQWRLGGDLSRLHWSESDSVAVAGRFRSATSHALHLNASYRPTDAIELAASYLRADAGTCELSGNIACTATGMGGDMLALGAAYRLDRHWRLFVLAARLRNEPGSWYGSAPQGASVDSVALGISFRMP